MNVILKNYVNQVLVYKWHGDFVCILPFEIKIKTK